MVDRWKFWDLFALLAGPIAVYVGFGALWLFQHGWGWHGFVVWTMICLVFGFLSSRWIHPAIGRRNEGDRP